MAFDYDLFVIGGGSGGVRAARLAAGECGAKVGLAEEYRMGGTCVIRGCVPKKLMVFASEYAEMFDDARAYGWELGPGQFNWHIFAEKMRSDLERLEAVYHKLLGEAGVTTYAARATLSDPHTVELATGESLTAKHILLANGGHPTLPEMANAELGITSADIFLLKDLPKSILIVGGGYIACEFAGILNGMGVEVTQFYRGAQVLRGFDEEARGVVAEGMLEKGVDLHLGTNVIEMKKTDAGIRVKSTTGMERAFDQVMFATGRTPNTSEMGLEDVGVKTGRKGEVLVDDYSQTAIPSIYAIGDVTDRIALTPVAIREGIAFVETVFKGNPTKPDHHLVPSAIFTQPEMGTVGLSEESAAEQEPIEVYCASFRPMQRSFAGRDDRVLMKLVVSQETRNVLGCHIVADHAGEMIQLAGIAIKMGATKEDFDRTVAVHPTISEELVTMKTPIRRA